MDHESDKIRIRLSKKIAIRKSLKIFLDDKQTPEEKRLNAIKIKNTHEQNINYMYIKLLNDIEAFKILEQGKGQIKRLKKIDREFKYLVNKAKNDSLL